MEIVFITISYIKERFKRLKEIYSKILSLINDFYNEIDDDRIIIQDNIAKAIFYINIDKASKNYNGRGEKYFRDSNNEYIVIIRLRNCLAHICDYIEYEFSINDYYDDILVIPSFYYYYGKKINIPEVVIEAKYYLERMIING